MEIKPSFPDQLLLNVSGTARQLPGATDLDPDAG